MKKRAFTLIEVLIALGLTTMVLSVLTWGYFAVSRIERDAKARRDASFREAALHFRFVTLFSSASDKGFFTDRYGNSESLVLVFNNGASLDKLFSGQVVGRLFVDDANSLCLAVMPYPENKQWTLPYPVRCDVLYEGVTDVTYRFFSWSDESGSPPKGWHNEWAKEYRQVPAIVEVTITVDSGRTSTYRYVVPASPEEVHL